MKKNQNSGKPKVSRTDREEFAKLTKKEQQELRKHLDTIDVMQEDMDRRYESLNWFELKISGVRCR